MKISGFFNNWLSLFILVSIIFVPFSFHFFTFHTDLIKILLSGITFDLATQLGYNPILKDLSSDSTGFYFLFVLIIAISLVINSGFSLFKMKTKHSQKISAFTYSLTCYYLALILLKYGLDKIFKTQFNLPEPNLLYTPIGNLDKDILFWSTMGISKSYNLFMGIAEIVPAILLLFNRTRLLGALCSFVVLLNIVAINFSFDISVKLYSSFLLLLSFYLILPYLKSLFRILIFSSKSNLIAPSQLLPNFSKLYKTILKFTLILLILAESFYPFIRSGNFNDDLQERPYLHGAYAITRCEINDEQIDESVYPFKRFFIHRDGYMIFQRPNDDMLDRKLVIDQLNRKFLLTDYDNQDTEIDYRIHGKLDEVVLNYTTGNSDILLTCIPLNWKSLPLLRNDYHWSVD